MVGEFASLHEIHVGLTSNLTCWKLLGIEHEHDQKRILIDLSLTSRAGHRRLATRLQFERVDNIARYTSYRSASVQQSQKKAIC